MDINPEFRLSLEEVAEFAAKTIFKVTATNKFASCVDGRYPEGEAGAIALAGADTGFLEAAFAAVNELKLKNSVYLSDEAILNTIYALIGGKDKFQYHSDDRAGHDGCGHNKRATTRAADYGLTEEQAHLIKQTLQELETEGVKPTVLTGDHAEAAVLVISLTEYEPTNPERPAYSLHHQADFEGKSIQAFVYNQTLVTERLYKLADLLHEQLPNITTEDIFAALAKAEATQRGITVKELALDKGLGVYNIVIDKTGNIIETVQIAWYKFVKYALSIKGSESNSEK